MKCNCDYCGQIIEKETGHYNRAKKLGANIYCDKKCAGLARRQWRSKEELKEAKRIYDIEYRAKNEPRLKKGRAEYFKKDYAANPEKYRAIRRRRQQEHNEYCRQPEYRAKKKVYDQQRRAKLHYGKYAEAAIALLELGRIVDNRQAKSQQDNLNKSKKRRIYGKTYSKKPQERLMAIYKCS